MLNDQQRKIVEENHNLIYWVCNKYGFSIDEYYGLCAIALCNAVENYDSSKGNISTFCVKVIYNEVVNDIRKNNAKKRGYSKETLSYDNLLDADDYFLIDESNDYENLIARLDIDKTLSRFTDSEKEIINYIKNGYRVTDIAKIKGMRTGSISYKISAIRRKLKDIESTYVRGV